MLKNPFNRDCSKTTPKLEPASRKNSSKIRLIVSLAAAFTLMICTLASVGNYAIADRAVYDGVARIRRNFDLDQQTDKLRQADVGYYAQKIIEANAKISSKDVLLKKLDFTKYPLGVKTIDRIVGHTAKHRIEAGEVILTTDVNDLPSAADHY